MWIANLSPTVREKTDCGFWFCGLFALCGAENRFTEPVRHQPWHRLPRHGYRAEFFIGSSRDLAIIEAAQQRAPFDTALIDGDHSYEGARADGIAYGSLARIVAFHDIAGENVTK